MTNDEFRRELEKKLLASVDSEKLVKEKPSRNGITSSIDNIKALAYEILIEPLLKQVRDLVLNFIPDNSSVIDIACGPGALSLTLAMEKDCLVYGIDLDSAKVERAKTKTLKYNLLNVRFEKRDATDLAGIEDGQFGYATISMLLHSVPKNVQLKVLNEAQRVAKKGIVIADYVTQQPSSFSGIAARGIEWVAGGEHFDSFNLYGVSGGLDHLLKVCGLEIVNEKVNPSKTIRVVLVQKTSQ
jgi:2-polyprenyl-3-methyl-5-hydroxy-6-metoxy-1,4-benzoquinol methylase